MKNNIRLLLSGARASWATYMVDLTPTVFFGMRIPRTILQSLFFVYLAKAAGGDDLARFALIGNAIQIAVFNVMLAMEEVIESEKWNNTFQYLIAAPSSWFPSMVGSVQAKGVRQREAKANAQRQVFAIRRSSKPFALWRSKSRHPNSIAHRVVLAAG